MMEHSPVFSVATDQTENSMYNVMWNLNMFQHQATHALLVL